MSFLICLLQFALAGTLTPTSGMDRLQVRPDSTIRWIPSHEPHAQLFHSDSIPREYYLYVRPERPVQMDLSLLNASQQERVRTSLRQLSSYFDLDDLDSEIPIVTMKAKASDRSLHLEDFDRTLVIRKTKRATAPIVCVLEYDSEDRTIRDTLDLSGDSFLRLRGEHPVSLRSVTLIEPNLYNHPSIVSGLMMEDERLSPVYYGGGNRTLDADYPFVGVTARVLFDKTRKIWKDTELRFRVSVMNADAQLEDQEVCLLLHVPAGWNLQIPGRFVLPSILCLAFLLLASVFVFFFSRKKKTDGSAPLKELGILTEEKRQLSERLNEMVAKNNGLMRTVADVENRHQAEVKRMSDQFLALERERDEMRSRLSALSKPSASMDVREVVSALGDFFKSQRGFCDEKLNPILIPLDYSWQSLVRKLNECNRDGHYLEDSARGVLREYLDDSGSCLNTVIRLYACTREGGVSESLAALGYSDAASWWSFRMVSLLLKMHGILLKEPPSLFKTVFDGNSFDMAVGYPMLSFLWPPRESLSDRALVEICRAGYSIRDEVDVKYAVFYYIAPKC